MLKNSSSDSSALHASRFTLHANRGFTLVEIILVATIFAILAAGVASSFLAGMRLWSRAKQQDLARANAMMALETIARDVRQSVNVPALGFKGEAQKMSFPCITSRAAAHVTYLFRDADQTIRRQQMDLGEALEENLQPDMQERTITAAEGFADEPEGVYASAAGNSCFTKNRGGRSGNGVADGAVAGSCAEDIGAFAETYSKEALDGGFPAERDDVGAIASRDRNGPEHRSR